MADVLRQYLGAAGRQSFAWGKLDCFLFVADWIEQIMGADPAAAYRGNYADEHQGRALIKAHGGAVALAERLLSGIGCAASDAAAAAIGDVALVRVATARADGKAMFAPVGAICVRPGLWAIKSTGATLTLGKFPVVRAWTLPHA